MRVLLVEDHKPLSRALKRGLEEEGFAVDLAEYSTVFAVPATVSFVGYRHDGSVVTMNFVTDGIIDGTGPLVDFQTFYFDSQFSDLDRVVIPSGGWSMDNLGVSVPEPSALAVLAVGGLTGAALRLQRQRIGRSSELTWV